MHWYMKSHDVPKSMPTKEVEALLSELREMRRVATMENADFFAFDPDSEKKMNELRELTRVWRQSWLIGPLDALIKRYETGQRPPLNY